MTEPLEVPRSFAELYLARGRQVSLLRPIMTGDVFSWVDIPGVEDLDGDDEKLAMIVTHPCSMRLGAVFKERQQVIRVIETTAIELPGWKGYFDRLPLPELRVDLDDELEEPPEDPAHYAALFEMRGKVPTDNLLLHRRIACLSEEGVAYLHQRMGHADTRYSPRIRDLMTACAGPFAEAELEQEWKERFIEVPESHGEDRLLELIRCETAAFDEILSEQRVHQQGRKTVKSSIREDLSNEQKKAYARREVHKIMRSRAR
jgi:hypothetical protein